MLPQQRHHHMTRRVQVYLPEETATMLDATRPSCQSKSQWIALMAHFGLQRYHALEGTVPPATCQQAPSAAPEA
jgi:uncharacterized protein YchJ